MAGVEMTYAQRSAPLTDAVIVAVARLVDDSQTHRRDPSHSDLAFEIKRAGLAEADPQALGQTVGKEKRVRTTLSWSLEFKPEAGEALVVNLISHIRGCGGFRETSPNFVGNGVLQDAIDAFGIEGYELTPDGELRARLLDGLSGVDLTAALEAYVRRARRGYQDAALVTGTGKDLLEATAAHILVERWNNYPASANFPALLGQTFIALDLATPQHPPQLGEPPQKRLERAMYDAACAINHLRNKEGTGHGRPWLSSLSDSESKAAVEMMGVIADYLLSRHKTFV